METKVITLPVENIDIWNDYNTFKEYVSQFVPNLSSVSQIACPWGKDKGKKPWQSARYEVFRKERPRKREEFIRETLKTGQVTVCVFTK